MKLTISSEYLDGYERGAQRSLVTANENASTDRVDGFHLLRAIASGQVRTIQRIREHAVPAPTGPGPNPELVQRMEGYIRSAEGAAKNWNDGYNRHIAEGQAVAMQTALDWVKAYAQ